MNIKKENSRLKSFVLFTAVCVVLFLVGIISGMTVAGLQDRGTTARLAEQISGFFLKYGAFIFSVLTVALLVVFTVLFSKSRSMYRRLKRERENDVLWDQLEDQMNAVLVFGNFLMIYAIFEFGLILAYFDNFKKMSNLIALILAIAAAVIYIAYSDFIVRMEKDLNPEKKGEVLDFRFNKIWMASSGEAEKMITYQAGYHAFHVTNISCCIFWVLTFIGMISFDTGVLGYASVCLIWVIHVMSYSIRAKKLEKN